jgi:hypothetical protein
MVTRGNAILSWSRIKRRARPRSSRPATRHLCAPAPARLPFPSITLLLAGLMTDYHSGISRQSSRLPSQMPTCQQFYSKQAVTLLTYRSA